ncbi:MAG: hypothetical protein ACO24H_10445 [Polynucleobacter sp.]
MNKSILLTLSLYLAIHSSNQIAIKQLLSEMYTTLDLDPSKKLLLRLLPLLTPKQRDYLRSIA